MTSDEMTQGSVNGSEAERKWAAARSKWWNSTGGGSFKDGSVSKHTRGNVKAGDGGAKFREQWAELDAENWTWIREMKMDPITGNVQQEAGAASCAPVPGLTRPSGSQPVVGAVVEGGREGTSWMAQNRLLIIGAVIFTYVLVARLLGEGTGGS